MRAHICFHWKGSHRVSTVKYTFENARGLKSHIDHFIISNWMIKEVKDHNVYDDIDNMSDHQPIYCRIDLQGLEYINTPHLREYIPKLAWYKANNDDLLSYRL